MKRTLSNLDMATPDLKSYIGKRVKHAKTMEMNKRLTDGDEPGEERKSKFKQVFPLHVKQKRREILRSLSNHDIIDSRYCKRRY